MMIYIQSAFLSPQLGIIIQSGVKLQTLSVQVDVYPTRHNTQNALFMFHL